MEYGNVTVVRREQEKLASKLNRQSLIYDSVTADSANQLTSHNSIKVKSRSTNTSPSVRRKIRSEICKYILSII